MENVACRVVCAAMLALRMRVVSCVYVAVLIIIAVRDHKY